MAFSLILSVLLFYRRGGLVDWWTGGLVDWWTCGAQYRKLLQARDGWHRSIIEHAIMSGRTQIFEAVFDALRKDVHDEKVDGMEPNSHESEYW